MILFAFGLPTLDSLGKIVVFLLMISILVVLHEGGHFLLARLNGVRVNDFAVGFGPTLLKWTSKRSGTNYRLNLLPIGGYCAMQGEDGKTSEAEQQREFREQAHAIGDGHGGIAVMERPATAVAVAKPNTLAEVSEPARTGPLTDNFQAKGPWQRLSIVVAGPVANFLLAFVILYVAAVAFGTIASDKTTTQIGPVTAGSPGDKAGLQIGDRITAIDGVAYSDGATMLNKIRSSPGRPLSVTYDRRGAKTTVQIVPDAVKDAGKTIGRIGFVRLPVLTRTDPIAAIPISATELADLVVVQAQGIATIFSNPLKHAPEVSGVIGMERAAAAYQDLGWGVYLRLAAMISLALGMFNLLPVPALDGGRGVFIIAELLRGRPVDAEKEAIVHFAGFAVLMALMVMVAFHDIANIVSGKGVF